MIGYLPACLSFSLSYPSFNLSLASVSIYHNVSAADNGGAADDARAMRRTLAQWWR